jgi:hypothetical protein
MRRPHHTPHPVQRHAECSLPHQLFVGCGTGCVALDSSEMVDYLRGVRAVLIIALLFAPVPFLLPM